MNAHTHACMHACTHTHTCTHPVHTHTHTHTHPVHTQCTPSAHTQCTHPVHTQCTHPVHTHTQQKQLAKGCSVCFVVQNGPNDYVIPPMARPSRHSIHLGTPSQNPPVLGHQRSLSATRLGNSTEESPDLMRLQIERYIDCGGTCDADLFQQSSGTGAATNGHDTRMDSASPTGGATATQSPPPPEVNETDPFPAVATSAEGAVAATPGALSKMQEADGADTVVGWNSPPEADEGAPPPYMARGVLQRGAHVSLKHSQVTQLKGEMASEGGVTLTLSKLDCHHTMAFVDCFHAVW